MAPAGRPVKEFQDYPAASAALHIPLREYKKSPATAFLRYAVDAKDAANRCQNWFPKKGDGTFAKQSLSSLRHILAALLPAIMGHFETYERYLFAGVFDYSTLLKDFDIEDFFKALGREHTITIDPVSLSAYRGFGATTGILLADNLAGWHNPERVSRYFKAFGFDTEFFSNDDCRRLNVLWQLRHSIVHTGASITLPDAQRVPELGGFGGMPVVFEKNFILEVSRKLHPMVRDATARIENAFRGRLVDSVTPEERERIDKLFLVKSRTAVWLR